jgi:hypothetical protein
MICFRLDKQLMAIAKDARCIYTRYADDITFSSRHSPAATSRRWFLKTVDGN